MKRVYFTLLLLFGCVPLRQAPVLNNESAKLIDQGVVHLRKKDLNRAQAAFHLSLEVSPSAQAIDGLGCVEFLRNDLNKAEYYFLEAIKRDPKYGRALANLAMVYERRGDYNKATALFQRALQLEPQNFQGRNNYAGVILAQDERGSTKIALAEYLKAAATVKDPLIERNIKIISSRTGEN